MKYAIKPILVQIDLDTKTIFTHNTIIVSLEVTRDINATILGNEIDTKVTAHRDKSRSRFLSDFRNRFDRSCSLGHFRFVMKSPSWKTIIHLLALTV